MIASVGYVGLDVHKASITIAVAREGRKPAQVWKTIPNDGVRLRRALKSLVKENEELRVCYEAGPTGFGLCRRLRESGIDCKVVAPSLVPGKPGERVKRDRRDARRLAHFLRSGDLTEVYVPEEAVEAIRERERARDDAKRAEGVAHLTEALETLVEGTVLAPLVKALRAFRGVNTVSAVTIAAEVGDLRRFRTAGEFMSYVGLVPSEASSGKRRRQGAITRCGNAHLRWIIGGGGVALLSRAGDECGVAGAEPGGGGGGKADCLEGPAPPAPAAVPSGL